MVVAGGGNVRGENAHGGSHIHISRESVTSRQHPFIRSIS